jgi:hypothetical protein
MADRPIDVVLARLNNLKCRSGGYQASCPCHDHQDPSVHDIEAFERDRAVDPRGV